MGAWVGEGSKCKKTQTHKYNGFRQTNFGFLPIALGSKDTESAAQLSAAATAATSGMEAMGTKNKTKEWFLPKIFANFPQSFG
jgi:hypothetical protein